MHDNVYDCLSSKTLKEVIKIIKDWIKRGKEEEWVEAGRSQFTICVIQLRLSNNVFTVDAPRLLCLYRKYLSGVSLNRVLCRRKYLLSELRLCPLLASFIDNCATKSFIDARILSVVKLTVV